MQLEVYLQSTQVRVLHYSLENTDFYLLGKREYEHGMTRNTKALLYSALVFPGCGQLFLTRYKSAALFIILSIVAIIYIIVHLVERAHAIVDKIVAGDVPPDYIVIRKLLLDQQNNADSNILTMVIYSLVAIWLLSIIDVLRLKFSESSIQE